MHSDFIKNKYFYTLFFKKRISYFSLYQGWHLEILLIAIIDPLKIPYSSIELIAYCEQVGSNLHVGGVNGEIKYR
jgi:hypothetical protein